METNPSSSSSSSSSPPAKKFDVFLSFRGEDTRNNFTGHLSLALRKIGLFNIFKDDYALEKGKDIWPELKNSIQDSQYAVVVLSENYATSSWCLRELAKIVKCAGNDSLKIRTIFYHVNPSDVRNVKSMDERKQKGSFWEAMKAHQQNPSYSEKTLEKWRNALVTVANQSGYPIEAHTNEAIFIKEFVAKISHELGASIRTIEGLFGMTSRLKKLDSYVLQSLDTHTVCFLGIHGMGGMGKSTLARAYYNRMSHKFDGSCFLQNIREVFEKKANGLVDLQKQLLSDILKDKFEEIGHVDIGINMIRSRLRRKKVLIVLDDVSKEEQLTALAEEDSWFGSGSIIIVTTREDNFLKIRRYAIYRAEYLNSSEALQLFSWKAFRSIEPPKEFQKLSEQVIEYASYLPLALIVLGSLLGSKSTSEWESALLRLTMCQEKEIVEKLKISFDDLNEIDQHIFLDIACFFKRHDKDYVVEILDCCGFHPIIGIRNLINKSLLSIQDDGELWMHDLLVEMGKGIVRKKSGNNLGRQSRIWDENDLYRVLENEEGTNEVEAIVVFPGAQTTAYERKFEALSSMKNLRLLVIYSSRTECDEPKLKYLSNNLQYLEWSGFSYNKLPSSFQPRTLVQLKLWESNIEQLWNNCVKPLYNLKVIDLMYLKHFTKFEDFQVVPNLEKLILFNCEKLSEIHPSIKHLKKLILLELQGCRSLERLPEEINGLTSLQTLNLSNCEKLSEIHPSIKHLKRLILLDLGGCTSLERLPEEINGLASLQTLNLSCCEKLSEIHPSIKHLKKLILLDLTCCTSLERLPEEINGLASLQTLNLSSCEKLSEIHPSIKHLKKLILLDLKWCTSLERLPEEINGLASLQTLNLFYCEKLSEIHPSIKHLKKLILLDLQGCKSLERLPEEINGLASLQTLNLSYCEKLLEIHPSIEHLKKLILLDLEDCTSLKKLPEEINGLASLQTLNLRGCSKLEKLPDSFVQLTSLRKLDIEDCSIKHLPSSINLMEMLESLNCDISEMIVSDIKEDIMSYGTTGKCFLPGWFSTEPESHYLLFLTELDLRDCNLSGPEAFPEYFGKLVHLKSLDLSENPFSVLPSLIKGLTRLESLGLSYCKSLRSLEADLLPSSLQEVDVSYCTSLASFLDPSKPCHLRCSYVSCVDCTELVKRQDAKMTALASLSRFVDQDPSKRRDEEFRFLIPRSDNELPSWFPNQSSTASVSLKFDPNRRNSELIGIAMVFCYRSISAGPQSLNCKIGVSGGKEWKTIDVHMASIWNRTSDHLLLLYMPCGDTLEHIKNLKSGRCDSLDFYFLDAADQISYHESDYGECLYRPYGVRLVYEEDIEELKQITTQYNNAQKDVQSSHSQSMSQLSKLRHIGPFGPQQLTGLRGILDLEDDLEMQQYADEEGPNNPESNPSMVGNTHFGVIRNYTGITTKLLDNLKGGR